MGGENIIIHVPIAPVDPEDVYAHVTAALGAASDSNSAKPNSAKPNSTDSSRIVSLHTAVSELLAPFGLEPQPTGNNCLLIEDYDDAVPATLAAIEPALAETSALVVLEMEELVWRFGDETTDYLMSTSEYRAGWASVAGIPAWLDHITGIATMSAKYGIGSAPYDFLIIESSTEDQTYTQCYFDTDSTNYRVEMRLGSADEHYARVVDTRDEAATVIQNWMTGTDRNPASWDKLNLA